MPVDPIPLATTATLVSSRIIKELEHVKQEWTAFQRCNFPPDLVHCISLVRLCHHEMQEIADTTNRALLETLREETQIQLVLDLVVRQVETAVEDLKYLEAEVGAMRSGENHRRMEHRWRKVNMEIDVCSARWHCHTAWLEWTYVMDVIKKWKAYTVIMYEMPTITGNLSTTTAISSNIIDVRGAVLVRQIQERIDHAVPGFEDILITSKHLEDLKAWITLAKDAVQDSLTRPSDRDGAQRAIEECTKVHELAVMNMANMTSISHCLAQGYYEQVLSIIAADVTAAGLDIRIFDALFPEVVPTGQLPVVGRFPTAERQDAKEGSPIRRLDLSESDSEDDFEHV